MERVPVILGSGDVLIRARDLMTSLRQAMSLKMRDRADQAARRLDAAGFDFAPVIRARRPVGYAAAQDLRDQPGLVGEYVRPIELAIVTGGDTLFRDVLVALSGEPFIFVLEGRLTVGFLTPSDLNKHTARLHFYFLLAGLEIALSNVIRDHWDDPFAALTLLSQAKQADIVARFDDLRGNALDLDPIALADLSDLLVLVGATSELRARYGKASRRSWDRETSWVPDFRHKVMHPVRPLVRTVADLTALADKEAALRKLFATAARDLGSRPPSAFTRW
jgi:hypothetical protein